MRVSDETPAGSCVMTSAWRHAPADCSSHDTVGGDFSMTLLREEKGGHCNEQGAAVGWSLAAKEWGMVTGHADS